MTSSETASRVLVVEDDVDVNRLVCSIFGREGLSCDTANDGAEAIDFLSRKAYDVLILDLQLPKLSGYNVLQFLRSGGSLSRPLVIIVSGRTEDFYRRVDPSQVAAVIRKPFDVRKLALSLTKVLAARAAGNSVAPLDPPAELDFAVQLADLPDRNE